MLPLGYLEWDFAIRKNSPTFNKTMDFLMGDLQPSFCVKIPPGIAHGGKAIQGPVHLLYVTSHIYNPQDEFKIKYDDPKISFDWLKDYEIT
jgi:dTDP-4-dehydrorhamnose 3,5-epimerase